MNSYGRILLFEAGIIFLSVFCVLFFVYKSEDTGAVKRRSGIYRSFSAKSGIYIIVAAFAITYFVSKIAYSGFTSSMVFLLVLGLAPLMLDNEKKRIGQENLFSEIILYCQNMGMLLKQTHNVYSSLEKASEDLSTDFGEDLRGLLTSLEEGKDQTMSSMRVLESNYPYSCIKNLDIIILHMFFETSKVDDSLLSTYQDDVATLEQDVRKNKAKRKSLRMSYVIITAGSLAAYWYFVRNLSGTFSDSFDTESFRILNLVYIFATMLSFFFVDRYFNLNTTRE